jgi:crotonobetainyl-CoA:carnitine CoA-transferase CaiB-like acyl-CoA transferase
MRYPASIADLATALYGLGSTLAALYARERTGHGQFIDLSLVESQAWWGMTQAVAYLYSGIAPGKLGNDHPFIVPYGVFKAQDGYLIIGCATESLWQRLCDVLDLGDAVNDPRYRLNRERVIRRAEVRALIEERLASRPADTWWRLLDAAGIPSGPIYDIPQMLADEHMRARGLWSSSPTHGGDGAHPGQPAASFRDARRVAPGPAALGQHTAEVLADLGYSEAEIAALREKGAV